MVLVSQVSGGLDWILLNWRSSWGNDPHLGRCGSLGRVEAARPLAGYILMVRIEHSQRVHRKGVRTSLVRAGC